MREVGVGEGAEGEEVLQAPERPYARVLYGEALLDVMKMMKGEDVMGNIEALPLMVGFVAAFLAGCVACKWMINIVKRGKLIYFGIYCAIVGVITIICSL